MRRPNVHTRMCLSEGQLTERERWKPEQNLRNRTDCGEPRDLEYWNPRHRAEPDRQPGEQLASQLSSQYELESV